MITETTFADQSQSDERSSVGVQASVLHELGSIEFRVIRTGLPARRMRLNATRCTLGSGEGCTVRLNDSTLRPMHAVILRDSNRVLLRGYTVPIEVNGHLTGETFLRVGDQFTLGSYCFELTDAPEPVLEQAPKKQRESAAWSELPLRVAATPLSFTDQEAADPIDDKKPAATPARGRLSFVGGGAYVSEALQAFSASSLDATRRDDATTRSSFRADADHLRNEVDAWRKREQRWKEQDLEMRGELEEAVSRFQESQARAVEAGRAVAEMRARMEQLSEELAELKNDSIEYRQQAAQRQERLREAADAASEARAESLRQRDEANREYEEIARDCEQLVRERDQLRVSHEQAIAHRNEAIAERDLARGERDRLAFVSEEFGQHLNRAGSAQTEMTDKIRKLTTELNLTAEQLRAARTELSTCYAKVETASIEAAHAHKQLQNRDQAQALQTHQYELSAQSMRSEISRLEAELDAARSQAASAASDRRLVESLQTSLASTESHRTAERLSWEQEAAALQNNIQQLSLELAAVTGRMTQAEIDHTATKSALDDAQGRLSAARRELTMRPTPEQWDELQSQLADTEKELENTEKQLRVIRQDYDELLGHQANPARPVTANPVMTAEAEASPTIAASSVLAFATQNENVPTAMPAPFAMPAFASDPAFSEELVQASEPSSASGPLQDPIEDVANAVSSDHGWPTYQTHSDYMQSGSASADFEDHDSTHSPLSESWPSSQAEIADRLQSYTAHDESHRLAQSNESVPLKTTPSMPEESRFAAAASSELRPQTTQRADAGFVKDKAELGSLAKQLISQLSEANASETADEYLPSTSQPLTASSIWERVPDQATSGTLDRDNDTPSLWTFSSQFRAAEDLKEDDDEEDSVSDGEDIDEEVEVDYLLREKLLLLDRDRGLAASDEQVSQQVNDEEPIEQTFMLPMEARDSDFGIGGVRATFDEFASGDDDAANVPSSKRVFDFHAEPESPLAVAELASAEAPMPMVVREEPVAAASTDEQVDDDSIEAYMNRLLKRVQGQSGVASEKTSPKPVAEADNSPAKTSSSSVEKPTDTPAPLKPIEVIDPNTPLVRRSQAPEHAANLAAMREIANATADTAISQSVRGQAQQLKSKAIMDLFQAGVVFACAAAFYFCGLKVASLRYVWFTAAVLAASLACFFLMDMMKKLSSAKASYDRANSQASSDFNEE